MPEIEFDPVDTIAAGAVGVPGDRSFYIQATQGGQVLAVLVEKQQVAILAERVRVLLEQVATQFPREEEGPALAAGTGELQGDPVPLFRALAIGIGYDPSRRLVVLELHEEPVDDEDDEDDDDEDDEDDDAAGELGEPAAAVAGIAEEEGYLARLYITAAQARAMAARGRAAVEAGRPPCPLCGGPLDPAGHDCPRLNGHARRDA